MTQVFEQIVTDDGRRRMVEKRRRELLQITDDGDVSGQAVVSFETEDERKESMRI